MKSTLINVTFFIVLLKSVLNWEEYRMNLDFVDDSCLQFSELFFDKRLEKCQLNKGEIPPFSSKY